MADEQLQRVKALNEQEQVVYHLSRERTRGFRDVGSQLFRTRRYAPDAGDLGNPFTAGQLARPVTIQVELELSSDTPNRAVWQFGAGVQCFALAIDDDNVLKLIAGNTTAPSQDDAATIEVDVAGLSGRRMLVTACCVPGAGRLGLFIDGELIASAQSVDPTLLDGQWAGTGDVGAVGGGFVDLCATFAAGTAAATTGVALVSPVQIYEGVVPRQFGRQRV